VKVTTAPLTERSPAVVPTETDELVTDVAATLREKVTVTVAAGVAIEVQRFAVPGYPRRRPLPEGARGLSALDAWLEAGESAPHLLGTP
jgi:hypothetical protein